MNYKECGTAHLLVSYSCHCQRHLGQMLAMHLSSCHFFSSFDPLLTPDPTTAGWDAAATGEGISRMASHFHQGMWLPLHLVCPQWEGSTSQPHCNAHLLRREEVGIGLPLVTKRTKAPALWLLSHNPTHLRPGPVGWAPHRPSSCGAPHPTSLPRHSPSPTLQPVKFFVLNLVSGQCVIPRFGLRHSTVQPLPILKVHDVIAPLHEVVSGERAIMQHAYVGDHARTL